MRDILHLMPLPWRRKCLLRLKKAYRKLSPAPEKALEKKAEDFLRRELKIGLVGGAAVLLAIAVSVWAAGRQPEELTLERNAFGEGDSSVNLVLEGEEEEEAYTLALSERELTEKEWKEYYEKFFTALEEEICGENPSLAEVSLPLVFDSEAEDYPFTLTYEVEDPAYIQLDGSLGEEGQAYVDGGETDGDESLRTEIYVTAEYQEREETHTYEVVLKPKEAVRETVFDRVTAYLKQAEEDNRQEDTLTLETSYQGVKIREEGEQSFPGVFALLAATVFLLLWKNYSALKEGEKRVCRENVQDFSLIVHLLTLYMGAGLSFASSVRRICGEYQANQREKTPRYAFEEMLLMNQRMEMGVSQKEACLEWGKQFEGGLYQKLSFVLVQNLTKGTKEARALMENAEQDAFRQRIDRVRKEGEEASTKLLFPMIVLLGIVMLVVMFPAVVQFYSF